MSASTHLSILVRTSTELGHGPVSGSGRALARAGANAQPLAFEDIYDDHFNFVWRSAKRLGVRASALDDVVQEVFVVVHRRLGDFEGRSTLKTWIFGITLRVARDQRRSSARHDQGALVDPDTVGHDVANAAQALERAEAVRLLHALLDQLDDERREVFVMAELEEMTMPEIAETLGINVNTAYSRLRAARQSFEEALARHRATEGRSAR